MQQVVGTRRGTHGQQEPRTLEVRQHREFMQEPCLFKRASICVGGDVERMPDGGAQCDESTLGLVCVSVPHACPKCGDSWRSWPASTVVRPGLAKISGDACPRFFCSRLCAPAEERPMSRPRAATRCCLLAQYRPITLQIAHPRGTACGSTCEKKQNPNRQGAAAQNMRHP